MLESKCPKYDCEEYLNNIFKQKKSISDQNPSARFTLKISANQDWNLCYDSQYKNGSKQSTKT